MILFFSDGRFGNQLFQYAFISTILLENEKAYCTNMNQLVDVFNCYNQRFKFISTGENLKKIINKIVKPIIIIGLVKTRLIGYIKQNRSKTSAQPQYTEIQGLLPIRFVETNFFQSELFFDPQKIDIKLKASIVKEAERVFFEFPTEKTKVFVHVRRGDYLNEIYLGEKGINLPVSYYKRALQKLCSSISNPFIVFLTDDYNYVKENYEDIEDKYISTNSMEIDFTLMTLCEYGVVSNSSFSWWGAYFMTDRKQVIFPKYWYGWKQKIESHISVQPSWAEIFEFDEDTQ